jgi:hypoxanthine phosphoribosyltransferase
VDVKEIHIDDSKVRSLINKIGREILIGDWRPDYIVGISRGGLVPAVLMSHWLNLPLYTLKVSLRDGNEEDCDHNCWMAEDALGYPEDQKNILIVDDINDSGATFRWIKRDWMSALPKDSGWDHVWSHNVRFAVLVHNSASTEISDYVGMEINKVEDPSWCVFPWEGWWMR